MALKQMIVTIIIFWMTGGTVNQCLRERGSNPWSSTKTCCLINSYSDPEERSGVITTGGSEIKNLTVAILRSNLTGLGNRIILPGREADGGRA